MTDSFHSSRRRGPALLDPLSARSTGLASRAAVHSDRHLWPSVAFEALFLIICLACGCRHYSSLATNFFPDSSEVPGWSKAPEIRTFTPDHLADYIDGDAEKYLKAGVRSTSTADYKFNDKIQVVVDVYTLSTPQGAKAIFESEPAMDAQSPSLGDAARLYSQSLFFRKGPYLVRIVAYQDSPQLSQALVNLGFAIEKKLSR